MRSAVHVLLSLLGAASAAPVAPQHAAGGSNPSDDAVAATLRTQDFIHIPGPNPILTVGGNGTWDSSVIECAGGVYSEYDSAQPPVAPARPHWLPPAGPDSRCPPRAAVAPVHPDLR